MTTARTSRRATLVLLGFFLVVSPVLRAQVPQLINYQGRVAVNGVNFQGAGLFRFALVDATGATTYWSNDGTSTAGSQPANAISLTVNQGTYSVLLGDASVLNMTAIPPSVFEHSDVRLRVWFNDGANGSQKLSPDQRVAPVGYAMMAANVPDGTITAAKIAVGAVGSAQLATGAVQGSDIANGAVGSAQLASGAAAGNLNASGQSGVGSGGIVLSPTENPALISAGYVRVGQITTEDAWQKRVGASGTVPISRESHTAVWTGSEMIVWGGYNSQLGFRNDGGQYNPTSNNWTTISTVGTPAARRNHTAVWTGSKMIIWGGDGTAVGTNIYRNDGGIYDPTADNWVPLSLVSAPAGRNHHTAVWTGSLMIVWGGSASSGLVNSGGRFNPVSNTWAVVSSAGAPTARYIHSSVWTGTEMLVWGGWNSAALANGARYNPTGNAWSMMTATGAPLARYAAGSVWTGTEFIIWGGSDGQGGDLNDGGRFNPTSSSWLALTLTGAPTVRDSPTAIWTGNEMLVWGGFHGGALNTGGGYDPANNAWSAMRSAGSGNERTSHSAIWTGQEMIVWGGSSNGSGPTNDILSYSLPRVLVLYQRP